MNKFFFLLLLSVSGFVSAQTVHDYQYVVIPTRFELQSEPNQYRLNTIAKKWLTDAGFTVYYESQLPDELINRRCDNLYFDIVKAKSLLSIRVTLQFKDCRGHLVFESKEGMSKQKDYEKGYIEATQRAFEDVTALDYAYNGAQHTETTTRLATASPTAAATVQPVVEQAAASTGGQYTVEALANGYLIIESASQRVALKILKTSDPKIYTASNDKGSGVFINKNGKWFFEYYKEGVLLSEEFKTDYAF